VEPIDAVADELAAGAHVLALDELHVTDLADALILGRLLARLLSGAPPAAPGGGADGAEQPPPPPPRPRPPLILITGNRPPGQLYRGGPSRKFFAPMANALARRLAQLRVGAGRDYRALAARCPAPAAAPAAAPGGPASPESPGARGLSDGESFTGVFGEAQLQRVWGTLLLDHGLEARPETLAVGYGRSLAIARAARPDADAAAAARRRGSVGGGSDSGASSSGSSGSSGVWRPQPLRGAAYLGFDLLCGAAGQLGPADYVAIAAAFSHLCLEGVPAFSLRQRDEARRFVTLVDALYDAGTRLWMTAALPGDKLFFKLLASAAESGADPSLGRADGAPPAGWAAPERPPPGQAGHRSTGPPGGGTRDAPAPGSPRHMAEEEVLGYHRAASRLMQIAPSFEPEEVDDPERPAFKV
jgi:predicted ATPase